MVTDTNVKAGQHSFRLSIFVNYASWFFMFLNAFIDSNLTK